MSRGEGELLTVPKPRAVGLLSVCLTVKPVGEPDALIGHVRFDERGWETERCQMAQATAPILNSTMTPFGAKHYFGPYWQGPTPGTVIRRRHTSSSRTIASKRRCKMLICSSNTRRTTSNGSTNAAKSGRFSTSSLIRASNFRAMQEFR